MGVVPAWCFRGVSVFSSLSQIHKGGQGCDRPCALLARARLTTMIHLFDEVY